MAGLTPPNAMGSLAANKRRPTPHEIHVNRQKRAEAAKSYALKRKGLKMPGVMASGSLKGKVKRQADAANKGQGLRSKSLISSDESNSVLRKEWENASNKTGASNATIMKNSRKKVALREAARRNTAKNAIMRKTGM
jgi:hypothetical protein